VRQSPRHRSRIQAHDRAVQHLFVCIGVGIGIEIAIGGYFDADTNSDPNTDFDLGISRYQHYFGNMEIIQPSDGMISAPQPTHA